MLNEAERAWAASKALRTDATKPTGKAAGRAQANKRLARAIQHATALLQLYQRSGAAPVIEAEATIYKLILTSTLAFEKAQYSRALPTLYTAQALLNLVATKSDAPQSEALAYELLDDVEPMIRVSLYRSEAKDVDRSIVAEYQPLAVKLEAVETGAKSQKYQTELKWKGESVPIRNAGLAKAITKAETALAQLGAAGNGSVKSMGAYERTLAALGEAEDLSRKLVDDNQVG